MLFIVIFIFIIILFKSNCNNITIKTISLLLKLKVGHLQAEGYAEMILQYVFRKNGTR